MPEISQTIPVNWAFVVAVDSRGHLSLIDYDHVTDVHAKRAASMDDMYSAAFLGSMDKNLVFTKPYEDDVYSHAFLVFQIADGRVAASPNIFENVIPVAGPTGVQALGAFGVLQGLIIAQKTAEVLAVNAAMSTALKNQSEGKTPGGLLRV